MKNQQPVSKTLETLLALLVFVAAALPVLLLLKSAIKFELYCYTVLLCAVLFLGSEGYLPRYNLAIRSHALTLLMIGLSGLCVGFQIFPSLQPMLLLFVVVPVVFFVPGWLLIRGLFKTTAPRLDLLVLSFATSFPLNALILVFSAWLPSWIKGLGVALVYFSMVVVGSLLARRYPLAHPIKGEWGAALMLGASFALPIISIVSLYPSMALVPGLDIVRHFSSASVLLNSPQYYDAIYPLFHTPEAIVISLAPSDFQDFQFVTSFMTIILPVAFFVMVRRLTSSQNAIMATVFFTVASGFGWFSFLSAWLGGVPYTGSMTSSVDNSYWDTLYGNGPWIWLWFRPFTVGLTLLFSLIYLLRARDVPLRGILVLLCSFSLALTHFSEFFVWVALLTSYSIVGRRRGDIFAGIATVGSTVSAGLAYLILGLVTRIQGPSLFTIGVLASVALASSLLTRTNGMPHQISMRVLRLVGLLILVGYVGYLVAWILDPNQFSVSYVGTIYSVPNLLYPVLLGLPGIVAIASATRSNFNKQGTMFFVFIGAIAYSSGKLVGFVNQHLFTQYVERRVVPLVYAACSVIAADFLDLGRISRILRVAFISMLVLTSTFSTLLAIDGWSVRLGTQNTTLNNEQIRVVGELTQLARENSGSVLLTYGDKSRGLGEFAPFAWNIDKYRTPIWSSNYPELPTTVLSSLGGTAYVLLQRLEMPRIAVEHPDSFVLWIIARLRPLYETGNFVIFELPRMTPPVAESASVLMLSTTQSDLGDTYAPLLLSDYTYTTALQKDVSSLERARTIFVPSEYDLSEVQAHANQTIVVLNTDGYAGLADRIFNGPRLSVDLTQSPTDLSIEGRNGLIASRNLNWLASSAEFAIVNSAQQRNALFLQAGSIPEWTPSVYGSGSIGPPLFSLSNQGPFVGNASLETFVPQGTGAYWKATRSFTTPLDLRGYDFLSFYWNGRDDGKSYVVELLGQSGKIWYSFQDSWEAWHRVLLPLKIQDGSHSVGGVNIQKVSTLSTLNPIEALTIGNEASNPSAHGVFLIDGISFDSAPAVDVRIQTTLPSFDISDGKTTYVVSANNSTLEMSGLRISSGESLSNYFGNILARTNYDAENGSIVLNISLRIPPPVYPSTNSSIRLRLDPIYSQTSDGLSFQSGQFSFDKSIPLPSLQARNSSAEVLAWYQGGVPYALHLSERNLNIVYVNVYPLIRALTDKSLSQTAIEAIHASASEINLPVGHRLGLYTDVLNGVALFSSLTLSGNLNIFAHSGVLESVKNGVIYVDGLKFGPLSGDYSLPLSDFEGSSITGRLSGSSSLYAHLELDNGAIEITGSDLKLNLSQPPLVITDQSPHNITITFQRADVVAKNLRLQFHGLGSFSDFYPLGNLAPYFQSTGQLTESNGQTSFVVKMGGTYLAAYNFNTSKFYEPLDQLQVWNEMGSLLINARLFALVYLGLLAVQLSIGLYRRKRLPR